MSRIWKNSTGFSPKFFSLILAVVFAAGFVWFTDTQAAYAQDANIDIQVSNNTPVVGETITFTINISYSDVLAGSAVSIVNEGQLICQNLNREVDLEFSIIVPGVIVERTNGLANGVNSYICPVIIENETDFVENFEYDYTPIGGPSQDITIIDIPIDVIAAPDTPQIELIKSPAYQVVEAGQQAVFTFTIKNTGNVPLEKITVEDSMISNCKFIISPLTAGEVFTKESFSCEITADQSFTNTAEVTAVTSTGAGQVVSSMMEEIQTQM